MYTIHMETKQLKRYRPRRDFSGMEQWRLKAAKFFSKGVAQAEVARQLDVSRQAVHVWFTAWRKRDKKALVAAGRKPKLTEAQLQRTEKALLLGPRANGLDADLWNLPRIAAVIARVTGVLYHPGHVSGESCVQWAGAPRNLSLKPSFETGYALLRNAESATTTHSGVHLTTKTN